jgi:uncharacterized phage protein (TIGR01671 family)
MCEVDPATVGRFTGLLDKNGTKIFEDDIVRDTDGNEGIVRYSGDLLEWRIKFRKGKILPPNYSIHECSIFQWTFPEMTLTVIGNIYDPEVTP